MRKVTERAGRNLHFLAFFVPLTSPSHRSLAFSFEKDVDRAWNKAREGGGAKSSEKGWNKEEMRKNGQDRSGVWFGDYTRTWTSTNQREKANPNRPPPAHPSEKNNKNASVASVRLRSNRSTEVPAHPLSNRQKSRNIARGGRACHWCWHVAKTPPQGDRVPLHPSASRASQSLDRQNPTTTYRRLPPPRTRLFRRSCQQARFRRFRTG